MPVSLTEREIISFLRSLWDGWSVLSIFTFSTLSLSIYLSALVRAEFIYNFIHVTTNKHTNTERVTQTNFF